MKTKARKRTVNRRLRPRKEKRKGKKGNRGRKGTRNKKRKKRRKKKRRRKCNKKRCRKGKRNKQNRRKGKKKRKKFKFRMGSGTPQFSKGASSVSQERTTSKTIFGRSANVPTSGWKTIKLK